MTKSTQIKRDPYFDFLRGIAIIFVVGIHTVIGLGFDNTSEIVTTLIRQILNCGVPIFLAISGYFLSTKHFNGIKDFSKFLYKQSIKIYIPTLIWSIPFLISSIHNCEGAIISFVVIYLVCGMSCYYFIALIIQYYALLPILQKTNTKGLIGCALMSLSSVALITYIIQIKGVDLPLIVYAGPFPVWIMFFALGCYLSKRKRDYSIHILMILAVVTLICSCGEAYILSHYHGGGYGIKPSSFLFSLIIIMILFSERVKSKFKTNTITRFILLVGELSFCIYLTHPLIISAIAGRFPEYWILRWLIVLAIDISAIYLVRRIFPMNIVKYIGILH